MAPTRIGDVLSIARDAMLERLDRREPVSWLGLTNGGLLQISVARHDSTTDLWTITRLYRLRIGDQGFGGRRLARPWRVELVRTALVEATALIDPEAPFLREIPVGPRPPSGASS